MKRRNFLTATGVVGVGITSGIAATGQFLLAESPWRTFPGISDTMVTQLDDFASDLKIGLMQHDGNTVSIKKIVTPKSIIQKKDSRNGYQLVFENLNGKYIILTKDKKGSRVAIYTKLPDSYRA